MELVWMRNKLGQRSGTVAVGFAEEDPIGQPDGGLAYRNYQIKYDFGARPGPTIIGVPKEAVSMILVCGCTSTEKKLRSLKTSGRAPDLGNIWEVCEEQSPPAAVRKCSYIEIDGMRQN